MVKAEPANNIHIRINARIHVFIHSHTCARKRLRDGGGGGGWGYMTYTAKKPSNETNVPQKVLTTRHKQSRAETAGMMLAQSRRRRTAGKGHTA